jgi:glycosyltransferase involved in cell wall biosynthesis
MEPNSPHRVLMLIENLSFPLDRRMRQEALALRSAGYEVSVICPRGDNQDREGFAWYEGIRVYRYPLFWQASGSAGYLLEYGWAMACTLALMLWIFVRHGFDVVHAANPPDLFCLLCWPFTCLGKKFVYDQHDLCPETYESKFHRKDWLYRVLGWLERRSYKSASLVIATNRSFFETAVTRGKVPAEKLTIVRSGPDLQHFVRGAPDPALRKGYSYMVAYLGVMSLQDGVDRVVRAAHQLQSVRGKDDVLFTLIGKGDKWEELKALACSLGLNGSIQFTGRIPDADLLAYLSTADVCLAPDPPIPLNHMSTMNKIMEYMACGRPIVSFDLVESRRSAEQAAVYVADDDPAAMAAAINRLLEDPDQRRQMGEYGYERVCKELSWDHSARCLVEAYSRLWMTAPGEPRAVAEM